MRLSGRTVKPRLGYDKEASLLSVILQGSAFLQPNEALLLQMATVTEIDLRKKKTYYMIVASIFLSVPL